MEPFLHLCRDSALTEGRHVVLCSHWWFWSPLTMWTLVCFLQFLNNQWVKLKHLLILLSYFRLCSIIHLFPLTLKMTNYSQKVQSVDRDPAWVFRQEDDQCAFKCSNQSTCTSFLIWNENIIGITTVRYYNTSILVHVQVYQHLQMLEPWPLEYKRACQGKLVTELHKLFYHSNNLVREKLFTNTQT